MNLQQHKFDYQYHTSLTLRADKMDWAVEFNFNRPLPTGQIRLVTEDEP